MLYPLLRDALLRGAFQRDAFSRVALGNESDGRGVWDQEFVIWCEFDGDNNLLKPFFQKLAFELGNVYSNCFLNASIKVG